MADEAKAKAPLIEHVEGKVKVYHKKTGEVVEYWPRDASEVTGFQESEWTLDPKAVETAEFAPTTKGTKTARTPAQKSAKKTSARKAAKKRGG